MIGLDRFKAIQIANTPVNRDSIIFDVFGPLRGGASDCLLWIMEKYGAVLERRGASRQRLPHRGSRVFTVNIHHRSVLKSFRHEAEDLDATPLHPDEIGRVDLEDPVVISPDKGAGRKSRWPQRRSPRTDIKPYKNCGKASFFAFEIRWTTL